MLVNGAVAQGVLGLAPHWCVGLVPGLVSATGGLGWVPMSACESLGDSRGNAITVVSGIDSWAL